MRLCYASHHEFTPAPRARARGSEAPFSYCNLETSGNDMALAWRSNQMTVGDDVTLAWTKGCNGSKGCDLSR